MTRLVLIRGLPGSGKSTMARVLSLVGFRHHEADMFYERGGRYEYDPAKVGEAHQWCLKSARDSLVAGESVVVSNTFTRRWEMQPYHDMARELGAAVTVIEADGKWQNVHGVPAEVIEKMRNRWEAA